MKVILLKDVAKTGKKFEVKDVSDGFALNHLIPRGLARMATPDVLKNVEHMKKAHGEQVKIQNDLLKKNLESLSEKKITISAKANEKGHLFKGIHTDEIVKALEKEHISIASEHIKLEHPIKEVGEHEITVSAHDVTGSFTLEIESSEK
ncbi:MAG: 50S ribosomal protein L9 [Candidatus Paceibacterota bacterium]